VTPAVLEKQSLPTPSGLDSLEAFSQMGEVPVRDDMALCFVCMRWASGDGECRRGVRCEYQLALDRLESHQ
jgi:hypothetical protein